MHHVSETLRLLDVFVPRITFGKVVERPAPPGSTAQPGSTQTSSAQSPPPGFSYVKRDLVRLLGTLAADSRDVQDRVRACGGIPVVMNLCVVDDQNPCTYSFSCNMCPLISPDLSCRPQGARDFCAPESVAREQGKPSSRGCNKAGRALG